MNVGRIKDPSYQHPYLGLPHVPSSYLLRPLKEWLVFVVRLEPVHKLGSIGRRYALTLPTARITPYLYMSVDEILIKRTLIASLIGFLADPLRGTLTNPLKGTLKELLKEPIRRSSSFRD